MAFPSHWWILGLVSAMALYSVGHYLCCIEQFSQVGLYEVDRMSKKDFQRFCYRLMKKLGYQVSKPKKAKQWVSFILEKDGIRKAVLVKQYASQVNIRPIEKAAQGGTRNNCSQSIVLTNRDYSIEARQRAQELGVELWNRDKLIDLLIALRSRVK